MATEIKYGESIYIPFVDGRSVQDSQLRPRMYKSVEQLEKKYPGFRLRKPSVVEYAPVAHGVWVNEDFPYKAATSNDCAICSVCGEMSHKAEHGYAILSKYCPHCGAKMDAELG